MNSGSVQCQTISNIQLAPNKSSQGEGKRKREGTRTRRPFCRCHRRSSPSRSIPQSNQSDPAGSRAKGDRVLSVPAREKGKRQKNRQQGRQKSESLYLLFASQIAHPHRSCPRARRVTFPPQSSGLSIQEPPRDIKGKRRALPGTPYSLRSCSDLPLQNL